ncbi:hypothetical protein D3C72_1115030 [compost metagenome]
MEPESFFDYCRKKPRITDAACSVAAGRIWPAVPQLCPQSPAVGQEHFPDFPAARPGAVAIGPAVGAGSAQPVGTAQAQCIVDCAGGCSAAGAHLLAERACRAAVGAGRFQTGAYLLGQRLLADAGAEPADGCRCYHPHHVFAFVAHARQPAGDIACAGAAVRPPVGSAFAAERVLQPARCV